MEQWLHLKTPNRILLRWLIFIRLVKGHKKGRTVGKDEGLYTDSKILSSCLEYYYKYRDKFFDEFENTLKNAWRRWLFRYRLRFSKKFNFPFG